MRSYSRINIAFILFTSLSTWLAIASISKIDLTFHEQITDYSCGAACLESVMEYWGTEVDQEAMLDSTPPMNPATGYTVGELKDIALSRGLQAFAIIGNTTFLAGQIDKQRPIIVPIMITYNEYRFEFASRAPIVGPCTKPFGTMWSWNTAILFWFSRLMRIPCVSLIPCMAPCASQRSVFEAMWAKRKTPCSWWPTNSNECNSYFTEGGSHAFNT